MSGKRDSVIPFLREKRSQRNLLLFSMKRISIFLLSLVFVFIPLNPAMAEQDYLDKRWVKTGCKPLNKQTKNALIPTDVQIQVRDNLNQLTGELINEQRLYFKNENLKEFKWIMNSNTSKNGKKEMNKKIRKLESIKSKSFSSDIGSLLPQDLSTVFHYDSSTGYKGACSQKGNKGMIFTVYLLKERNDKKPYKWLQFQSTGKGTDNSL
jgi:thymidylate synthase